MHLSNRKTSVRVIRCSEHQTDDRFVPKSIRACIYLFIYFWLLALHRTNTHTHAIPGCFLSSQEAICHPAIMARRGRAPSLYNQRWIKKARMLVDAQVLPRLQRLSSPTRPPHRQMSVKVWNVRFMCCSPTLGGELGISNIAFWYYKTQSRFNISWQLDVENA